MKVQFGLRTMFLGVSAIALALCLVLNTVDPWGSILGIVVGHGTVFAEGYHDSAWRRVHEGMPRSVVEQVLGEPISRFQVRGGERWDDTEQRKSTDNYHVRCVEYTEEIVSRKSAYFYVD